MLVERFDLARLQPDSRVAVLNTLQIGDSLFFAEHKEAQSMRVLSYYFLKTRNLFFHPASSVFRIDRFYKQRSGA